MMFLTNRSTEWDREHYLCSTTQTKARRRGAAIVFVDETGCSCRAKTGTTWAPRGQPPILRRVSQRREWSTVMGLTWSGTIDTRHVAPPIGATDMLVALQHVQRHLSRSMSIIWDRFNAHRAVIVQD